MITAFYTEIDSVPDEIVLQAEINKLPQCIKDKILSYKSAKDRMARLYSKLLLKKLMDHYNLSSELDLSDIKYTTLNKPYFDADFNFSIAHSENLVICAGIEHGQIGVDIEHIRPLEIDLMEDFFTSKEWSVIKKSNDPYSVLFKFWVRKEAFIKATGKGVLLPFAEIDVYDSCAVFQDDIIYIHDIFIKQGYSTAIAANRFPIEFKLINIDFEELLQLY